MPNNITNQITVLNGQLPDKYFKVKNGKKCFDFNKVVKMPKELSETEESSKTPEEVFQRNLNKYGYRSWYDWANEKWGTKWNAYNQTYSSNSEFQFDTAWKSPLPLIIELSKQNPELEIKVKYADEDFGYNCGEYTIKNGKIINDLDIVPGSKEAYELAIEVLGRPDGIEWDEEKQSYVWKED